MLNARRYVGGALLTIGIAICLYGAFMISLNNKMVGVGIGTSNGRSFYFLNR